MRSPYEPQIFSTVIQHSSIEGEFLREISNNYVMTTTSVIPNLCWENLRIPETLIQGMRIRGFPNLRKETYDNWISINNESSLLTPLIKNPQVTLISEEEYEKILSSPDDRWCIVYTLTRPGLSRDFSQALIQITAHCPAGPPQYGSLLYLENIGDRWEVKSSYGLYNQ